MKNSLATSMILIALTLTGGCATNLNQSFSPMTAPNADSAGTRVAAMPQNSPDELVTTNMKAAVFVIGMSEMSRLVDSARGQAN